MPSRGSPVRITTHALDQAAPPVWLRRISYTKGDDRRQCGGVGFGDAGPGAPMDFHRHSFYQMLWFRQHRGNCIHSVDLVDHRIRSGDLFLLAPEQMHHLKMDANTTNDCYVLTISCERLAALGADDLVETLFHAPERPHPLHIVGAAARKLTSLLDELSEEVHGCEPATDLASAALVRLLLVFAFRAARTGAPPAGGPPSHAARFAPFRRLLEAHYHEAPTVADLARRLGLSARQLNRICKEASGRSAHQLICDRVGHEARRLLSYSDQTVKEIAFALGFTDPAYFSRFFQARYQCSPNAFRAAMSGKYKRQATSSMAPRLRVVQNKQAT